MFLIYFQDVLNMFFYYYYYCECSASESRDFYCGLCVASAVPLKLAKMYFWLTLRATSRGLLLVLNRGVTACTTPTPTQKTYAPCPLGLHYDGAQTCECEFITNGRRGRGSRLNQNGFFTAVHRSLHEHMTNNHSDIELRYEVIS